MDVPRVKSRRGPIRRSNCSSAADKSVQGRAKKKTKMNARVDVASAGRHLPQPAAPALPSCPGRQLLPLLPRRPWRPPRRLPRHVAPMPSPRAGAAEIASAQEFTQHAVCSLLRRRNPGATTAALPGGGPRAQGDPWWIAGPELGACALTSAASPPRLCCMRRKSSRTPPPIWPGAHRPSARSKL